MLIVHVVSSIWIMDYSPHKLFFVLLLISIGMSDSVAADQATYIIHMDKSLMPAPFSSHHDWYMSMLSSLSSQDAESPTHLYTYNHVLDGFSAVLSRRQVNQLEKMPGHVATFRETVGKIHTTYTPKFLGLKKNEGLWHEGKLGDDTIIGIIDTGIWPESESFKDEGMPPVPDRWRGACETGVAFNSSYFGASTIDRDYVASVSVNNGNITVQGKSIYPLNLEVSKFPVYFGYGNRSKEICDDYSLDPKDVEGKIVFCDYIDENSGVNTFEVDRAGGAGAIFSTDFQRYLRPRDFDFPYVALSKEDGVLLKDYLIRTENAAVDIKFQITMLGAKPAPMVVWFSSRGPDRRSPWILKPDVVAPGVDIVAAWSPNVGMQPLGDNFLLSDFAMVSGTSMSSPHVVGIAALIKAAHRDWSPAAIRSAMMTTAYVNDNTNGVIIDMTTDVAGTPLDYGAGHVDPNKALDPGLVYDLEVQDYINYLCGMNYTSVQIKTITRRSNYSCARASLDLNYPSFMVLLNNTNAAAYTFNRVLTNVVDTPSVYRAIVVSPSGMKVDVEPSVISFTGLNSKAQFKITVEVDVEDARPRSDAIVNYGFLSWNEVDGSHVVRSPIVSAYAPYV
ncbi:Subtilisin-like protease, fibronectin type-III domain [Dillenia turbinata]|uniref:Subtilisin-like protease, fibronectin type-III domain n=1 Tax=Dillenia turbinata TaxID=194707 RepID=A0AAN8WAF7_9MAGN